VFHGGPALPRGLVTTLSSEDRGHAIDESVLDRLYEIPEERRKFLNQIDRAVPADLTVHLVLDNCATHKTKEIRAWFLRHPRYQD